MKHRFVTHNFILLPIPDSAAEQVQALVFSASGTKPAALPNLPLSLASSLGHANAQTHRSEQRRLNLSSSFPSENGGLLSFGVYFPPAASLRDLWNGCFYDALPGTLTHIAYPQGLPQGIPSPRGTDPQTWQLYPWLSLCLFGSPARKTPRGLTSSSWREYPSAISKGYSSFYALGTSGRKNKENTHGPSSLSQNYRRGLPEEVRSGLLASCLPQKFSSSRSSRVRRGQYAGGLFCLPQSRPRQRARLLFYRFPAGEQDSGCPRKDRVFYSLTDSASATDQNQNKSSCLTLRLPNGILYPRPDFLAMPAQYRGWRGLLYRERGLTFLNFRFSSAIVLKSPNEKEILFLGFAAAQPEFFLRRRRLPPAHSRCDSRPVSAFPVYSGLFLRTQLPLLLMPAVTLAALRLEPFRREYSCLQRYSEKMLAPYADLVVSSSLAHHPFCPARGVGLKLSAVFYRLKERCAIFICSGLNSWPLTLRYSHDLNLSHTKPLSFQDYFYRYYKTLPINLGNLRFSILF